MAAKVGAEQAKGQNLPTGTVTFLFSDIEGSSQRWEQHREAMKAAVARHEQLLTTAIQQRGGYVFKTVGDAFCAAFATTPDAVEAALDAQQLLAKEDFSSVDGIRVRIGIHTGHAQERNGDYFGPALNRVARLMSIGHGGQVLLSQASFDLAHSQLPAGASLVDLGLHRLRDLAEPEHVWQLSIGGLSSTFPLLRSLDELPNNLPRQATAFIGRDQELIEVKALLQKTRVLTIIGTGGVGKTRIALQIGADLLDGSGDGVWFVDLGQGAGEDYVGSAIASVFGLKLQPDRDPLDDVRLHLKHKHLLLILDNCEQLVGATSRVVAAIARDCPQVVILATSREGLNVRGEQVYRLPSLSVPARNGALSAEEALKYGAIALFVERALARDARFSLTDDKAPIVADICRRLDGIALAIELAAARVAILNVKQLAQRLDERFHLLTGGDRTALPRQQTMRATIDWSFELLSQDEQTIFCQLSIFQGGFTLEAAGAVCSDESLDEFKVVDILTSLVNKSLVVVEFDTDTQRYRLLESLRQYGLERLSYSGALSTIAQRHARFFDEYTQKVAQRWHTTSELAWIAEIETELDNIRAALQWCIDEGKDPIRGAQIVERLWAYWFGRPSPEARRRLEAARAIVKPEEHAALSVAIDLALSRLLIAGSWEGSFAATERALVGARALGDKRVLCRALFYHGEAMLYEGRLDEAEREFNESRDLARTIGDRYREATLLHNLGRLLIERKLYDVAGEYCTASLNLFGTTIERNRGLALITRAEVEAALGNVASAIELAHQVHTMGQALGDRDLAVIGQCAMAVHQVTAGRFEEATHNVRTALIVSQETSIFSGGLGAALFSCIRLATHNQDFDRATRLVGYAQVNRAARLIGLGAYFDADELVRPLAEALGEQRVQTLLAEGSSWSQERGFEEALAVCSD